MEKILRKAILDSDMKPRHIAQKCDDIAESQLSYFLNGHRSLSLKAASKLATILGYELVPKQKKRKAK